MGGVLNPSAPHTGKFLRAMKHLHELESILGAYCTRRPCEAWCDRNSKGDRNGVEWLVRAQLPEQPPPDIPFIIGDFINNLRASLDYLVTALVPGSKGREAYFPIVQRGVPYDHKSDTGVTRVTDPAEILRIRCEKLGLDDEAIAVIERAQPYRSVAESGQHHWFSTLGPLGNADKHKQPIEVVAGLSFPETTVVLPGSESFTERGDRDAFIYDGGVVQRITLGPDVQTEPTLSDAIAAFDSEVDVKVTAVPKVAIQITNGRLLLLPERLRELAEVLRDSVIGPLDAMI